MQKNNRHQFSFEEVSARELGQLQEKHFARMFANRAFRDSGKRVDPEHRALIERRNENLNSWALHIIIKLNSEPVGWHTGFATDGETYYMKNSAVLEQFRNQGAYSALLNYVMEKLKREGFQVVTSLHHPNNAAVLIPKLKVGFVISSMQLHEKFQSLIELKYFYDSERRQSFSNLIGLDVESSSAIF